MIFNAQVQRNQRNPVNTYKGGRKDRPYCTHCKFQGHTKEKCVRYESWSEIC